MHKIYNNISLAYGTKKITLGTEEVIKKMKKNKKVIVFLSANSSINTFKQIQNKAFDYNVTLIILNDINDNLKKIFKNKEIKVLAIDDNNFRKLIKSNMDEE